MSKKTYIIEISGESGGSCFRELSKSEYELISGILEDCNSEYVGRGRIGQTKMPFSDSAASG